MRILIVEDEIKTAAYLRKGLAEQGYAVDCSRKGTEGLECARQGHYDLVILDIMLPGRDGWSILSELRGNGERTPVLVLTARDAVADRVKGLELGADDYLVKPFAFSELLARVRSVLRRTAGTVVETLRVADLEIDLVRHRALRGNRRLDLTPKELALLELFARRRGEVLTRSFLAQEVWDIHSPIESNVVDVHVRRLRAKVDDPFPAKLIHTVRGVGYVLEERA
jgi:two-component system, OmpR family, copper resistance phosphate regulon response regulator CusR